MSLAQLKDLKERVGLEAKDVQQILTKIDEAIAAATGPEIELKRRYEKKTEGTVNVIIDGFEVKSTVPRRVEWDSELLDETANELAVSDQSFNPAEWLTYKCSISEKKYKEMPERWRALMDAARTIKHGAEKIELKELVDK